ncbi:unnamed protein product [Linum tenue]|uniref:Uncharacterized protein n=1 Tax=Linum tenue TaxID=586396 RepID=A0AAV0JFK4_9ROSI|nr:unnamed protein product [Linum tenue]
MAAFSLTSDNQFIVASYAENDPDLYVYEYKGDPNALEVTQSCDGWETDGVRVGPSEHADFRALELFGVTIQGTSTQWRELMKDLKLEGFDGQAFRLVVNRLGQCFVNKVNAPSVRLLRLNDRFGWSKYGVELPKSSLGGYPNVWNVIFDIYSGETVVDVRGIVLESEEAKAEVRELRKSLEEKQKEVENAKLELELCKRELECTKGVVMMKRSKETTRIWSAAERKWWKACRV